MSDVTVLLEDLRQGKREAAELLLPLVYDELRKLAHHYMRSERPNHTLQATGLVHEAYMRMIGNQRVEWRNRAHFVGVAAHVMRRVLIDHARGKRSVKRGGLAEQVPLLDNDQFGFTERQCGELLLIDDALDRLDKLDPQQAKVVELRF